MRILPDKRYAYSRDYVMSVCDVIKWMMSVMINIMLMSAVQFLMLSVWRSDDMDEASRGVIVSR